jgi:hypothetical protein
MAWPTMQAVHFLIAEEQAKGNWTAVANELTANWPTLWLSSLHPITESLRARQINMVGNGRLRLESDTMWYDYLTPLLESLIKTNRLQEAEDVIKDIAKYGLTRDFQRKAAELALKCGREDLQASWLKLEIPLMPNKHNKDDLDTFFDYFFLHHSNINSGPTPCLV